MTTAVADNTASDFAPGLTATPAGPGWTGPTRDELAVQLAEFGGLADDWDTYGARTIDRAALHAAQMIVEHLLTQPLPVPRLFPLPTGGIQLEWAAGPIGLE